MMSKEELTRYFKVKYAGKYYVHMRYLAANYMRYLGYTKSDMSEVLNGSRGSHHFVNRFLTEEREPIQYFSDNFISIIQDKIYPKTVSYDTYSKNFVMVDIKYLKTIHHVPFKERKVNDHRYYNTEQEMLIPEYNFNGLSESEKLIYEKL